MKVVRQRKGSKEGRRKGRDKCGAVKKRGSDRMWGIEGKPYFGVP